MLVFQRKSRRKTVQSIKTYTVLQAQQNTTDSSGVAFLAWKVPLGWRPKRFRTFIEAVFFCEANLRLRVDLLYLLCLLSRKIQWIFFFVFAWEFCIEKWRGFWWIFSGPRFPQNEARKILKKFGENPEQKFEKFGELSFCNFSDLTCNNVFQRESSRKTVQIIKTYRHRKILRTPVS